jgi:hypothetical protein
MTPMLPVMVPGWARMRLQGAAGTVHSSTGMSGSLMHTSKLGQDAVAGTTHTAVQQHQLVSAALLRNSFDCPFAPDSTGPAASQCNVYTCINTRQAQLLLGVSTSSCLLLRQHVVCIPAM